MKNLLTNILSGRRWLVVGAVLIATLLFVVSAWGATPGAPKKAVPNGGCTISGVVHTANYCDGYGAGLVAGTLTQQEYASLVSHPQGKISLYVHGAVPVTDTVGAAIVYDLRSAIAESPLYSLAPSASSADFVVDVATITPERGYLTTGTWMLVTGGNTAVTANTKDLIVAYASFLCGGGRVQYGVQNILSGVDEVINNLPRLQSVSAQ